MAIFVEYDSVLAWTKKQDRSHNEAFAARCALRALPGLGSEQEDVLEETALPVLRALLTSCVAACGRDVEYSHMLLQVDEATKDAFHKATLNAAEQSIRAALRAASTARHTDASDVAADAADTANTSFRSAESAARSIPTTYSHEIDVVVDAARSTVSFASETDATKLGSAGKIAVFSTELWLEDIVPAFFKGPFSRLVAFWRSRPDIWSFWDRWYQGMLAGRPLDWELQKAVALIPDEVWEKGAEAVADEIAKTEAERLADVIRETIEYSANGRLTLVPQPFKETKHLSQLLDVVQDTLDLATGNLSNGLSRDCYQAQLIERTLTRYGNDPHRIEMNFEQAKASLMQDMAEDGIPASSANRDLVQVLGDAAGSIRESDPEIAASRARMNKIRLAQMSDEDAATIAGVVIEVAEISEGILKEDLLEDRLRLPGVRRDDGVPDPIVSLGGAERNTTLEAQAAQLRIYSRLAKIWLFLKPKSREQFAAEVSALTGIISLIVAVVIAKG